MRILHLAQSDSIGGAARASLRIHKALIDSNIESQMNVGVKNTDITTIHGPKGKIRKGIGIVRPSLGELIMKMQKTSNQILHSPSVIPSGMVNEINNSDVDVVHLHWVCGEFLSIEEIGRINKPLVWTLHDMWGFSGAEHVSDDGERARWRHGYTRENRSKDHRGLDIDRWVWNRKRRAWNTPFEIVAPSNWLAECAKNSSLMSEWPITVIPNALDINQFQPWDKKIAREVLGLPINEPLLLFGAHGGSRNFNKGWDILENALKMVANNIEGVHGVIFGQTEPSNAPRVGMPLHWMGHLHDDATLSLLYSAADVMIVPSRKEAFGQTASEAHACGTPVVAFRSTGLLDIVSHKKSGWLADQYNYEDLARGIQWVLEDHDRQKKLGEKARRISEKNFSYPVIAKKYIQVYERALKK